ncbi:MAG: hypothetical protein HKN04_02290 [Rhodothermaceae bacterium]|nr:hypothetical protein [Rhodothermaceae bacterium]
MLWFALPVVVLAVLLVALGARVRHRERTVLATSEAQAKRLRHRLDEMTRRLAHVVRATEATRTLPEADGPLTLPAERRPARRRRARDLPSTPGS